MSASKVAGAASPLSLESALAPARRIWAVGGGKGGVGKSFVAANLAAGAARMGRHVVLVDADLGGANLHTCVGLRSPPASGLCEVLDGSGELLNAVVETPVPRLRLIGGGGAERGAPETSAAQRQELLASLTTLEAECIILDLSAGSGRATIDFFLGADRGFLVTTPEPTAIENAYAFLRASFFRLLAGELERSPVRESLRAVLERRSERGIRSPLEILDEVERLDADEAGRLRAALADYQPGLIVNQVRSPDEVRIGFSIRSVCRKYFGIDVDYVGYVSWDDCVWRSVKVRRPLVLAYPHSDGALYVRRILKKVLET